MEMWKHSPFYVFKYWRIHFQLRFRILASTVHAICEISVQWVLLLLLLYLLLHLPLLKALLITCLTVLCESLFKCKIVNCAVNSRTYFSEFIQNHISCLYTHNNYEKKKFRNLNKNQTYSIYNLSFRRDSFFFNNTILRRYYYFII